MCSNPLCSKRCKGDELPRSQRKPSSCCSHKLYLQHGGMISRRHGTACVGARSIWVSSEPGRASSPNAHLASSDGSSRCGKHHPLHDRWHPSRFFPLPRPNPVGWWRWPDRPDVRPTSSEGGTRLSGTGFPADEWCWDWIPVEALRCQSDHR